MKKLLSILLILGLTLALASVALAEDLDMATEEPAPVPIAAEPETVEPAPEAVPAVEPSAEIRIEPDTSAPIHLFSISVFTPEVGRGGSERMYATGTNHDRIAVDYTWTGTDGDTVTREDGVFRAGEYTLSLSFKAMEGYTLADPVSVQLVGNVRTSDITTASYLEVASSGVDETGVPVYELNALVTLTAVDRQASGEIGGWKPVNAEMSEELWDIYHRAMEGREDESWYEPYILLSTQVVAGTNYQFGANATEEYPYWTPGAPAPDFGPEVPFFFITIYENLEGGCEVVSIYEPMYEPGAEDVPVIPTGDSFGCEDGCIVGSYTPEEEEAFVEIKVNDQGAAAGIGGAEIKVPASEPGDYVVDVYVNGGLAYQQTIPVSEASVPDILSLTFSEDGSCAKLSASVHDLYARVALVLDRNGESGLYITQMPIRDDGVIMIPELHVPGLTVTGVNIALVTSLEDITSPTPEPVLFAVR